MAKQICHSGELLKALNTAGLLQHVLDVPGEYQKQPDGVILPICEIQFRPTADQAAMDAVNTIFQQQVARDWRTWIAQQETLLAAQDVDIKNDNIADQVKAMSKDEYDAWWLALTAAQKDRILKRMFRAFCRNRS